MKALFTESVDMPELDGGSTSNSSQASVPALLQAYPTKRALAEAFKGRLFAAGKKKMSRLKRIILRERAEKAFADATAAADSATAAARVAAALRDDIREQLRVRRCGLLSRCGLGFSPPNFETFHHLGLLGLLALLLKPSFP